MAQTTQTGQRRQSFIDRVLRDRDMDAYEMNQRAGPNSDSDHGHRSSKPQGCKNIGQVLKNIPVLKKLDPILFDQWERSLRDNLSLAYEATPRQMATIARLAVSESIRDVQRP